MCTTYKVFVLVDACLWSVPSEGPVCCESGSKDCVCQYWGFTCHFLKRRRKWFPSARDTRHSHSSVSKTDVFDKCASKCALYKGQVNNCHIADAISLSGKRSYPAAIAKCFTGHLYRISTTIVFGLLMRDVQRTSFVWLASISDSWKNTSLSRPDK
jgi:hypothetical protein